MKGGFVTYQSVSKTMLLGVPAEMIDRYDVVSCGGGPGHGPGRPGTPGRGHCRERHGLAGPDGGTPERPVGTVFLGVATAESVYDIPLHLTGNRARIRTLTMKNALNALRLEAEKGTQADC